MRVQNSLSDQRNLVCNSYVNSLLKTGEQIARVSILVSVVTKEKAFWAHVATTFRCGQLQEKKLSNVISSFVSLSVRASSKRNNRCLANRNCWVCVANLLQSVCACVQLFENSWVIPLFREMCLGRFKFYQSSLCSSVQHFCFEWLWASNCTSFVSFCFSLQQITYLFFL